MAEHPEHHDRQIEALSRTHCFAQRRQIAEHRLQPARLDMRDLSLRQFADRLLANVVSDEGRLSAFQQGRDVAAVAAAKIQHPASLLAHFIHDQGEAGRIGARVALLVEPTGEILIIISCNIKEQWTFPSCVELKSRVGILYGAPLLNTSVEIIMQDLQTIDSVAASRWRWISRRALNGVGTVICAGGLSFAYYAQFYIGLAPCPLCIFQRLALFAVGVALLAATLHNPRDRGAKVYGALIGLIAAIGATVAARHVWLQHLPPEEAPRCGPGLDYMLQTMPLNETIREVLTGSGECAEVDWTLLGFSIPEWTLLLFIGLGVVGVIGNWRLRR